MSKIVKVIGREIIDSRGNRLLKPKYTWKVVSLVWQQLRQVLLLVPAKRWNCAMATNPVSWAKAY
ncbi:Uncharacterised protein [Raoultella terrigena]|uniref:Uncharacterized protein n=1 Tax=Raoultella terrigena TaxID=577 RepID=A0A3P8JE76_RAOTE|nr:Uncharacterised protein [Raoultella terrigena]